MWTCNEDHEESPQEIRVHNARSLTPPGYNDVGVLLSRCVYCGCPLCLYPSSSDTTPLSVLSFLARCLGDKGLVYFADPKSMAGIILMVAWVSFTADISSCHSF